MFASGLVALALAGCDAGSGTGQANPCTDSVWETTWDPDPTLPGSTADRFAGTVWETDDYLFGNVERAGEGEQFVALFRWGNFQEQHPNCFDGEGRQRWNGQPTTGYR